MNANEIFGYTDLGDLRPDPVARVETESSMWMIDDHSYLRMPKTEAPSEGRRRWSGWGRLDDLRWMEHRCAYWAIDEGGYLRVRIRPVAGPADGYGIITGVVVDATGVAEDDPFHTIVIAPGTGRVG